MHVPTYWDRSHPIRRGERFLWFLLGVCATWVSAHGRDQPPSRPHRVKYPSMIDDILKRYGNLKDVMDAETGQELGFMQSLWCEGKRRSVSMIEGVRSQPDPSSSLNIQLSSSSLSSPTSLDLLAQSFALKLAWVVGLQAVFTVLFTNRQRLFEVVTRLVDSDTVAAVRTIQMIAETVDDHGVIDVFRKYPKQDLIASIYALSRLQAATEHFYIGRLDETPSGGTLLVEDFPVVDDVVLLDELNHYAPYASATYGWKLELATAGKFHRSDLHALTRITQTREEDIVKVEWESRPRRPAYYIVRDRKRKCVVLAIRGTWSAKDVLTDLCCTSEEYFVGSSGEKHEAHSGVLASARGVKSMAEKLIQQELKKNPDYSVVLVGHSLGGSVAAVLGQMWVDTFQGIRVYAYGSACVSPMDDISRKLVVSVLLEGDPFSSLSLGHVADTSFAIAHLCEDEDLRTNILVVTDGPLDTMDNDDLRWCKERMEDMRKQMTGLKLYPPGRLLFVSASENKKGRTVIRDAPSSFYGELRIGARMFDLRRHVPRVYQRRLTSALRSLQKQDRST